MAPADARPATRTYQKRTTTVLKIRRVLFPTDFSECSRQAFRLALLFAEAHDAELHLFHALVLHGDDPHDPAHRFPDRDQILEELGEIAENVLKDAADEHASPELTVRRVTQRAISALPAILDYAQDADADLIVMGTHGRGAIGRLVLGSVVREIVRMAPCPVLTVRQRAEEEALHRIRRIAVPVDFSDHSALALSYARELAGELGAELEIMHVVEEAMYPEFYYPVLASPLTLTDELREQVEGSLDEWLEKKAGPGLEADRSVLGGVPAVTIAEVAEDHGVDLIVISSHGRTGFERVLMGSVAEAIVRHAKCPVLTVKAFGKDLL